MEFLLLGTTLTLLGNNVYIDSFGIGDGGGGGGCGNPVEKSKQLPRCLSSCLFLYLPNVVVG